MDVLSGADGVAQSVVAKLGQLLADEIRQIRGVGDKVIHLRDELSTMKAFLRMLSEADEGGVTHLVREWMKQVRELAYDAEDCIDTFNLRIGGVPPRDGALLDRAKRWYLMLRLRRRLAGEIQALNDSAAAVSERRVRYGVDGGGALARAEAFAPSSSASLSAQALRPAAADDPDQLVGIQDQVDDLANRLNLNAGGDGKRKVFAIVGFGGLGKTTLAMEVCRRLEGKFHLQATVSASQAFDGQKGVEELLTRMLHQLAKPQRSGGAQGIKQEDSLANIDGMDAHALTAQLKERLSDKRYLVVIDDVWSIPALDSIHTRLPHNDNGSRIIVTTRIESVAKACSPASSWEQCVYQIKPLQINFSQRLFVARVFGPEGKCPDGLKSTMESILQKCARLPLAIVSIASLLANYQLESSKDMWERVLKSIGSQMESNPTLDGMRQIITLSYNNLPHHLKGCMMYMSIFPEDYVIHKNRLMYRWIAEGLVAEERGLTLLEVAESYFNQLISRNLIQLVNISYDFRRVEACQVHDMMLEVTLSKSLESNFVTLYGAHFGGTSNDKIRRISIHGDCPSTAIEQEPPKKRRGEKMKMQHVRSLSTFHPGGHELLSELYRFPLMRVLDLEGCNALKDEHVKHVCQLHLLRFLSLKDTEITEIPNEIGRLVHLQTLNLLDTFLCDLPQSIVNLVKLEFLLFRNKEQYDSVWTLPLGLRRMKALRVADKVGLIDDAQIAKDIGELTQLQKVTFILKNYSESVTEALAQALSRTYSLRELYVIGVGSAHELDFLHKLPNLPLLLRYILIDGVIDTLPTWINSLTHLTSIYLAYTELRSDHIISVLCKLPSLMEIELGRRSYIQSDLIARSGYPFPMLRNLMLTSDLTVDQMSIEFQNESMEKLEALEYCFGTEYKQIIGIEHLKSLKEVKLIGSRGNLALSSMLERLKAESSRRPKSNQFEVVARLE